MVYVSIDLCLFIVCIDDVHFLYLILYTLYTLFTE